MASQKIDLGVNVGSSPADIGKVGDALGGLGQAVDQVQAELADLAKSLNAFIAAKAALAGKTPRLLDLTADKAALEDLRASIKDVIAQNPSIKRHIDVANGKNANITSPSQINLPGIAGTAQGQAQFIERFITRLIARNQSAGKNKLNTGLTSQELLSGDQQDKSKKLETFQKANGLLGAVKQVASKAVQGGAGGTLGQAASSVLGGAADAKAAGAGMGGMLKGGGIALAAFAAYKVASAVDEGLDRAKEEAIGIDKFKRQLGDVGVGFDDLREQVRAASVGMGITYKESLKYTGLFASASNMSDKDTAGLSAESKIANSFARATGVANEETAKFFGEMRYSGATANPGESKQMALAMADAIKRTGSSVNSDQMLQSIASYSAQIKDATMGNANALGFADMLSGVMAANGLKAGAAAGLVNQVDASVRQGGVNEAWQAEFWQALNGKELGLGRYKLLQEGGALATEKSRLGEGSLGADMFGAMEGATDESNIAKIMKRVDQRHPGKDQQSKSMKLAEIAKGLTGDSFSKAAAFDKTQERYGYDGLNNTSKLLQEAGVKATDFNAEGINMLSELANNNKGKDGLEALRQSMLKRDGLSKPDKDRLDEAGKLDEQGMKVALTRIAADMGQERTQGEQLVKTAANLDNSLTKFATDLIPISIASRDLLSDIVDFFSPIKTDAQKRIAQQDKAAEMAVVANKQKGGTLTNEEADRANADYDKRFQNATTKEEQAAIAEERFRVLGPKAKSATGLLGVAGDDKNVLQAEAKGAGLSVADMAKSKEVNKKYDDEAKKVIKDTKYSDPETRRQPLIEIEKRRNAELKDQAVPLTNKQTFGALSEDQVKSAIPPAATPAASLTDAAGLRIKSAESTAGGKTEDGTFALGRAMQDQLGDNFNRVTATNDKYHQGTNSKHASGLALDYTLNDKARSKEAADATRAELKAAGVNGKVINEYDSPSKNATGGHIHVQFASADDAAKYAAYKKVEPATASLTKPPAPKEETLAATLAPNDRNKTAETDSRRLDRADPVKTPESTAPVNVPEGNPQAKAEAQRQAVDVNVNVAGKATLYDQGGQPAADPLFFASSGKVSKPSASAAGRKA